MISPVEPRNSAATRSRTASDVRTNSAEVPGVIFSRTSLMNASKRSSVRRWRPHRRRAGRHERAARRGGTQGPGLLGTMARTAVVAGTASAVVGGVLSHREARTQQQQTQVDAQVAAALANQQAAAPPVAPAVVPPAAGGLSDDSIAKLQQLGDLLKQGILTDQEFAAQKAKILGA